jgi:hypothetical protein
MTKIAFHYTSGTKFETVATETRLSGYCNLKNKAEGARRYGFQLKVVKATNPAGDVAFRGEFQTTLNGVRYQSSKYSDWVATEEDATVGLRKTMNGALKRYAKLAQNPASKIIQQ